MSGQLNYTGTDIPIANPSAGNLVPATPVPAVAPLATVDNVVVATAPTVATPAPAVAPLATVDNVVVATAPTVATPAPAVAPLATVDNVVVATAPTVAPPRVAQAAPPRPNFAIIIPNAPTPANLILGVVHPNFEWFPNQGPPQAHGLPGNGSNYLVMSCSTSQLVPYASSTTLTVLALPFTHHVRADATRAQPNQVLGRPSYITAFAIDSRGTVNSTPCPQCQYKIASGRGLVFSECRSLPGHFDNGNDVSACSNCKWPDYAKDCGNAEGKRAPKKSKDPSPKKKGGSRTPQAASRALSRAAAALAASRDVKT
ncbi:uncharacterized protein RAG0_02930 [Rhynchosporium agropyri]|uniref:Uncharacterized protein n=1 Tax=Rhynchosporium agropyri TaxID=914238 RepID=A0A1E1K355_9HELO|nr:uncharacterized protein RAG0_02930 [Rhynchosporium agropyri]